MYIALFICSGFIVFYVNSCMVCTALNMWGDNLSFHRNILDLAPFNSKLINGCVSALKAATEETRAKMSEAQQRLATQNLAFLRANHVLHSAHPKSLRSTRTITTIKKTSKYPVRMFNKYMFLFDLGV